MKGYKSMSDMNTFEMLIGQELKLYFHAQMSPSSASSNHENRSPQSFQLMKEYKWIQVNIDKMQRRQGYEQRCHGQISSQKAADKMRNNHSQRAQYSVQSSLLSSHQNIEKVKVPQGQQ
jgi:hypothetical protein